MLAKLISQGPKIFNIASRERKAIEKIVAEENISGIISDNRFGAYHPDIPSVFITHQLKIHVPPFSYFASRVHKSMVKNFNACWVPDFKEKPNYAGQLAKSNSFHPKTSYIGILSHLNRAESAKKYDVLVVLSGPEPQRSMLERILLEKLENYSKEVLFVRGTSLPREHKNVNGNIEVKDILNSSELESAMNSSNLVISRSGYSTIMDLAVLGKKALLIPTPGQPEQQYLARTLGNSGKIGTTKQDTFTLKAIELAVKKPGFDPEARNDFDLKLFDLFKGE